MKKLMLLCVCVSLATIISWHMSWASVSIIGSSTYGDFSGELDYGFVNANLATLAISLKNTSAVENGGYLTAFIFNNPLNYITGVTLSSTDTDFSVLGEYSFNNAINGAPYGYFDIGATTGGSFEGGGSPSKGIGVETTENFTFTLTGANLDTLNEASFISELSDPQGSQAPAFFVARFRGFENEESDKVPGTPVPEPATMSLLGAGLLFLIKVKGKRKII